LADADFEMGSFVPPLQGYNAQLVRLPRAAAKLAGARFGLALGYRIAPFQGANADWIDCDA
jgi:hypothetical protein